LSPRKPPDIRARLVQSRLVDARQGRELVERKIIRIQRLPKSKP